MKLDFQLAWEILPALLNGAWVTLSVMLPCLVLGMLIAVPVALARLSKNVVVAGLAWSFSMFFRGVPALVLIYMIYNGFPTIDLIRETVLWNVFSEAYYCAVIGFTFNHAGFLVEILRGAFQSVPKGVHKAAHSLALPRHIAFFRVTFPLAIRYGFSNYTNELVLFLKGTAAIGAITMLDLLAVANTAVSTTYDPFTPLVCAAFIYWAMVQIVLVGLGRVEIKLNKHLAPAS
jgi:His/Glu/Gln/Arg/opine family amino acid ABC transporter permease subunit